MPEHVSDATSASRRWTSLTAWLALATVIALVDQVTKAMAEGRFQYGERLPVIPHVFDLTLLYNPGAAFSFLADGQGWQRWLFTAIAVGAIGLILYLLYRHPGQRLAGAALSCILGGAVGNLIDRVMLGHVVDFLLFYQHPWYFPAFNLADVAITVGAILLLTDELLRWRRARRADRPA